MRPTLLAPLLVLPLLSCAGSSWQKEGASESTSAQDLTACQSQARAATRKDADIDSDILASRGGDWERMGMIRMHRESLQAPTRERYDTIVDRCMSAKGYTRG